MNQIKAIEELVQTVQVYKFKNIKVIKKKDYSPMIIAISETISSSQKAQFSYTKKIKHNPVNIVAINEIVGFLIPSISFNPKSSFLKQLCRSKDENLHSDFINALIKDPKISNQMLKSLGISGTLISSKRECRLDNIDKRLKTDELGARRIDIYIETDTEIMILENKQYTLESLNQTTDYYNVVSGNTNKVVKGGSLSSIKIRASM